MSKSSGGPDDPNRILLEQILKALIEGKENNYKSQSSYEDLKYRAEVNQRVDINKVIDKTTFEKLIRAVEQQNKHMGVATTSNFNQGDWKSFKDTMKNSMKDFEKIGVTADQMLKAILTYRNVILSEANVTEKRGYKSNTYLNVADNKNKELKELLAEMRKSTAASGAIDSAMHKVMDFVTGPELKKTLKQVGADLIEGLEKSKWVGGALRDTFRLVGLLGANWLSQFGQMGRILGGAFYVAMTTAGPLLVNILLKGIGKLFTSFPRMLGNLGKGLWNAALGASMKAGGPLADFVTAGSGQKLAAGGRLLGAGLASAALGTGAFFAGRESYRSFKQGDKVGGSAFGIGAAGLGVAAIAAIVAGVAAPVTLIAAAVGGIAVAVGAIWKNREAVLEHYKKHNHFYDRLMTVMEITMPSLLVIRKTIEWIRDHFGGKKESNSVNSATVSLGPVKLGGKGEHAQLLKGITNRSGHVIASKVDWAQADRENAVYGSMGQILNLGKMTQRRAAQWIKADIEQKGDNSYYEKVKKTDKRVAGNNFLSDAADDEYVYFVRGTMERFERDRAIARKLGLKGVEGQQILSGIGTLGSREHVTPHKYADSPDLHFGTTSTIDVTPLYWSDGKKFTKYGRYMGVPYEFHHNDGSDQHAHLSYYLFKRMEEKAKVKKEEEMKVKAASVTEGMNIAGNILKAVNPEEYDKVTKKFYGATDENMTEHYNNALKKEGIYQNKNLQGQPYFKEDSEGTHIVTDLQGNVLYNKFLLNQISTMANVGVN